MSEKKLVLVVSRSPAGQIYLGIILKRIWYSPRIVSTAEAAVLLARETRFSLILLDGDADGHELRTAIALLKNDHAIKDAPLVALRTGDSAETREEMVSRGCAAVLSKPLDVAILYGVLGRLSGEVRQSPRVPVSMRVELEEGSPLRESMCTNISEGGMYLRTPAPPRDGARLRVTFTLPRDTDALRLAAAVVRTEHPGAPVETVPGMALSFIDPPEEAKARIRNFVQWELMGDLQWEPGI